MKKLLLITLLSCTAFAGSGGGAWPSMTVKSIKSVYDGDTFRAYLPGYKDDQRVRVLGVDTPEIKGRCESEEELAIKARDFARQYLNSAKKITLSFGKKERDHYGRLLAKVNVDGRDFAQTLIDNGLGRKWKGKRKSWCD